MNAAFLLLTSAWMAGADPAPATPAAPAVVAGQSCCGTSCCDDGCGRKLFNGALRARLAGLFHKDCCDPCAPACPAPCAPVCKPVCPPACPPAPCCKPAPVCCPKPVCCQPAPVCKPACDPCADSCCGRTKLLDRLRGLFHKDCCGGCDPCCGAAPVAPAPAEQPKKMPATVGSAGTVIHPTSNPF